MHVSRIPRYILKSKCIGREDSEKGREASEIGERERDRRDTRESDDICEST